MKAKGVSLGTRGSPAPGQTERRPLAEQVVMLRGARAQEEARALADRGDFEGAKERLSTAAAELRKAAEGSDRADSSWRRPYENRLLRERKQRPE